MTQVRLGGGLAAIILGFGTFFLVDLFDGGFMRGFFQGATIALMVLGAYLVGAGLWKARGNGELQDGRHWLPSRDGSAPPTDQS